jgi:hypothetical protein
MYDFHAANQQLHHLLFHAAEVSEGEPLEQARAALTRFVTRGADAGEFAVDDPTETASFLLDGLYGLLLRSLQSNRSRRDFVTAAWSLCARLSVLTQGRETPGVVRNLTLRTFAAWSLSVLAGSFPGIFPLLHDDAVP